MVTCEWPTSEHPHYVPFLVRQVDFLRRAGVEIEIFSFRGARNPLNYLRAWYQLRKKLRHGTYDLIHAQWGQSAPTVLPTRLPLVVTFRGGEGEGIVGDNGRYTMSGYILCVVSALVARRADELVVVSSHMREYLPARPIHVVPSGLDFSRIPLVSQEEARRQLGLSPTKRLVLFVGNPAEARKRHGLAREIVSRLDSSLDAELVVAWRVPHELIPIYMNACDALLFVSMYEGSPNVVKEALACNLPIVSVVVGDVAERLKGVEGCALCTDDDPGKMATALAAVLRRNMRTNGRSVVGELDESLLAQRTIQIYRLALKQPDPESVEQGNGSRDKVSMDVQKVTAAQTDAMPFVSVVIPVRNEQDFIARTLDAILAQDYPTDRTEILVTDGMSDDQTRQIVAGYAGRFPRLRMLDNPQRVTPAGLNAAITAARGELILRIDGHCEVAADFVSQNVQLLHEHPEAWIVGGPIVHSGAGLRGKAVAIAMSHPLGVGMASHRFPGFEGYVDTVQFPAFRRWVFDRVGVFDTTLVRTEDDELNYRVMQAGGKMFVSPRVRYIYYVRDRIGKLFQQYFQYSFWRIPVVRKHKKPTTVRQVVPLLFFLAMAGWFVAGVWLRQPLVAAALPVAYASGMLLLGMSLVRRSGWLVASLVPVAVVTMHLAYASGMAYGILAALFGVRAWEHDGSMSALSR